jgi:putative flavoprotein involved in K+ transport
MKTIERLPVVVVGAGHAGLSMSYELSRAGLEHVVLERERVAQSWRTRWDSFCLVIPNWTMRLPGGAYQGDEPDGFMPRDEVVAHLGRYALSFQAPVRQSIDVSSIQPGPKNAFLLSTSAGQIEAKAVVLATGAYQKPYRPSSAASLPADALVIDAESYENPEKLPPGEVLLVGSGQTGCQIADDLKASGREVTLACGRAPWAPRRIEGRDIVSWIVETPFLEQTTEDLPSPAARLIGNVQVSGRDGGRDLNYRTLQKAGVRLTGHLLGIEDDYVRFAPDLHESVAFGDARYADLTKLIQKSCWDRGEHPPDLPEPKPFSADPPERAKMSDFGAVIFTSGFRPDYARWIHFEGAFDEWGFPIQRDGVSSVAPGLFFIGGHFLRKRKSATFIGIAEDAAVVAERVASHYRKMP